MRYRFIFLFAILLVISACNVEKPHLPSWDVTLNVPLLNETYLLSDLVDNEDIFIGDDDVLYLQKTGDLSTPQFGDVVFDTQFSLGPLPLPSGVPIEGSFSPEDQTEGYQIAYGEISGGAIKIRITGAQNLAEAVTITFDGLHTSTGEPFTIHWNGSSGWQTTSLVGAKIGTENSNQLITEIGFSVLATSNEPQGTTIGNIEVRIDSDLTYHKFQGILTNYALPSDESAQTVDIDYPYDIEEAVELQEADMAINLTNPIGYTCIFTGDLYAKNDKTGAEVTIPILDDSGNNLEVPAAEPGVPSQVQFIISNGVTELLQIMPHRIEIRNSAFRITSGTAGTIGTVNSTDQIAGTYMVTAPFQFILHPHTFLLDEPIDLEISQENQDRIRQNGLSSDLALQIKNMLPIGASATVYIGTTPNVSPSDSTSYAIKRSVTILPIGQAPGFQNVNLSLNEEELQVFANPMIYIQMEFSLDSGGAPVTITAAMSDYVQIRGMLKAKVHITEEGL